MRELDALLYQRWGTQGKEGRGVTLTNVALRAEFLRRREMCKTQLTKAGRVKSCSTNERKEVKSRGVGISRLKPLLQRIALILNRAAL